MNGSNVSFSVHHIAMDRSGLIQLQVIYTPSFPEQAMLGQGNDTGWPCATYNVVAVALQRRT
jgi:hypothetical protein